ncbi:MAG TPA: type VI secretion system protein [Trinickia sp.]|uniref:type VI secretion system protein n=1 Tax=Trinickia sp. TaxID=2571163 RepID=UPI002C3F50D1|nr:type VI secretion system protein [Trinickia sp.]HVW51829.1 type VI secretion system protein [Trinickia sp.]
MLTSNLFLLSVAVLIVVVLVVLGAVFWIAAHSAQNKPAAERKIVRLRTDSLRNAFRHAVELIEGNIASRGERYNVPWVIVLNEGDDPRPLPIAQAGVASVLSSEAANPAAIQGISWNFFDRGVVIDIKAAYLGSPDESSDEKPWDEFLSLCRNYRPQRPFDSVVVTVPASMLLADHPDTRLELERHAKLAHRRLWLAQNRFAMRFAVYVVVTGCEDLEGFAGFARALPEPLRASMLGWSSPFDLSTTYQSSWVDAAMGSIERAVSDASAELFTLDTGMLDVQGCLLLPARVDAMRAQLQLYVDELMRPSAYHEPFFFRGIYLTGDSGELAQRGADRQQAGDAPVLDAPEALDPYEEHREPRFAAEAGAGADGSEHDGPDGSRALNDLMLQPAFLRDLFEKKVFLEYGLTRPSRSQHLTRPLLHRAVRWGAIAMLGGWTIGLTGATLVLSHRNPRLVAALNELHIDSQERDAAARGGEALPSDWYRKKTLSLIGMNDQHIGTLWTVFMPGSWSAFDDLDERVRARFEHEFGEIALTALEREMLLRVSRMTGVASDPSTGQLIVGDDCTAPALGNDSPVASSLAVEDLPAMQAMQRYVASVDQLDAALAAMQRLQRPSSGNEEALRLVVRYAFGVELQGNVAGSLRYFYRDASRRSGAYSADGTGGLNTPAIREAVRCTFDKGAQQLDAQMFTANPLLTAERTVTAQIDALSVGSIGLGDFAQTDGSYQAIVSGIDAQQRLLASGKAGWMHQARFNPGPVWERTFVRATQNRLLGADLVAQTRERSATAFQAFTSEMAQRFGGPDGAIVWVDKDARYAVSPARLALRDGLAKLLAQPFMVAPRNLSLPTVAEGSIVTWDPTRLDQAIALGDERKKYLTDGLATLPDAVRPAVQQALDAQFARLVLDQVASAAAVSPADGDPNSAAFEAARPRLVKIRAALAEMGANAQAADLDTFVSSDAMQHLRLVDAMLTQSDLYATRPAYSGSTTVKPVLAAFGVNDAAALNAYLQQQSLRALALGKDAKAYLAALDAADANSPLAQRWRAIVTDLERYQLKNPNSSLLMLEQFLQTVAADSNASDCVDRFPPRPAGVGGDFFTTLHMRLYDGLLTRCGSSYANTLSREWDGFATVFNQSVAWRRPFSSPSRSVKLNDADAMPADFGELGAALKRYEQVASSLRSAGGPGARAIHAEAVRRFVEQFDPVDALLSPLYPAADGTTAGYDVNVDFRADRTAEVAGNQLIDWTIRMGDHSLSMQDAPHSLHWEYGMPVTLVLRFAKNSPLVAKNDPAQRNFATDGQTLTWQFTDPWALLSFVSAQRVADTTVRASAGASLLRFEFPLETTNPADAALVSKYPRGRVFVRVRMTPGGKKIPLAWPSSFPTHAPTWSAS